MRIVAEICVHQVEKALYSGSGSAQQQDGERNLAAHKNIVGTFTASAADQAASARLNDLR